MKLINGILILITTFTLMLSIGCKKNTKPQLTPSKDPPVVITKQVSNITSNSVISGGELTNAATITDKGVIWGTDSSNLLFANSNKISNGAIPSNFTDTIQNLQPGTQYYVKAYAVHPKGIAYGTAIKFTTLAPQPTVYLAGYHGESAAYWKNGKLFPLTNGTYAHSIYVVGNDVYVAGEENSTVGLRSVYWKNGTPVYLTDGSNAALANTIYVAGNDVYVGGYELLNNNALAPIAKYWKNGVAVSLTTGEFNDLGIVNSIYVVGKDVYAAGFRRNGNTSIATYWKNGIAVSLSDSTSTVADAKSIFVDGNDIYVAGKVKPGLGISGITVATYWKNGIAVSLTDGKQFADAYSIYVANNTVYVCGYEFSALTDYSVAKYWKNGTAFPMTDGNQFANAFAISVANNDVYVAGGLGDYYNARLWKNGVEEHLENNADYSRAVSIFIQ